MEKDVKNIDKKNRAYADVLRGKKTEYDGQWVMIKNSKVIAHGNDYKNFGRCRDKYPDERMLLVRIPGEIDLLPRVLHRN